MARAPHGHRRRGRHPAGPLVPPAFPGADRRALSRSCAAPARSAWMAAARARDAACARPVGAGAAAARPPRPRRRTAQPRSTRSARRDLAAPGDLSRRRTDRARTSRTGCRCRAARHHPPSRRPAGRAALRRRRPAAAGASAGPRHLRRAAAGAHARDRREARRAVPRAATWRRPTGRWSPGRPLPPEGRIDLPLRPHRRRPRRAYRVAEPDDATPPAPSPTTARSTTPARNSPGWSCSR